MGRPEERKEHASERPDERREDETRPRSGQKGKSSARCFNEGVSSSIEDGRSFCAYARFSGVENYATAGSREKEREV